MNQNQSYRLDGDHIYSSKTGNLIAILADGEVVMQNGYNGQGRLVKEFLVEAFPDGIPAGGSAATAVTDDLPEMPPEGYDPESETLNSGDPGFYFGDAPAAPGSGTLGTPDNPEGSEDARFLISSIPETELPPMDPALGIATPAVARFIKKHRMSPDQITALVRRLELKMKAL